METAKPVHLVVMGVSGTGKTTIARELEARLGWPFAEGDDFHPRASRDKMAAGHPLTDEDRLPWLQGLAGWAGERHAAGVSTLMACSALRRSYRDVLSGGVPGTRFVHLTGDKHELLGRMQNREHFFPPEMLESQMDTLEPLADDEAGLALDVMRSVDELVDEVLATLPPS